MALVKCRECGREVSSSAKMCPSCEIDRPQPRNWKLMGALIIGGVTLLIGIQGGGTRPAAVAPVITPAISKEVSRQSITVRGKEIKVGDTYDHVLTILEKSDQVGQEVSKDSKGELILWKHYKVEAKKFTLTCARTDSFGPYRIISIEEDL